MKVYQEKIGTIIERPALPGIQDQVCSKFAEQRSKKGFKLVLPESQEQILVLTVLNVQNSLNSGKVRVEDVFSQRQDRILVLTVLKMPKSLEGGFTRQEDVEESHTQRRISPSQQRMLRKNLAPVAGRDDARLGGEKRRVGVQGSGVEVWDAGLGIQG